MLNSLILFSLRNRPLVLAAAALLLAYGVVVLTRLPVDVLPDLNRPTVTVMTEAHGMAPEDVELLVSRPIESSMNGASGVERVRSVSSMGLSIVFVEFDWGSDLYRDRQLVAERLSAVRSSLPAEIVPQLGPITSVMGQIMLVGLSADTTSPMALRTLADFTVRRRLLTIPGVAQVTTIGGEVKQFQVVAKPSQLKAFGVSLDELEQATARASAATTGGYVEIGAQEYPIRNLARAANAADVAATAIRVSNGVPVTIGQVADVREAAAPKRGDASVNARPAVILAVEKQPDASTLELSKLVDSALAELKPSLPRDARIDAHVFRQADFIDNAIGNVEEALRDGAILVTIVLLLFLLNVRTTAITLTAIPLSMVITALVFWLFGISINTMTLGGLAVAIGEVVDDAIVDVENVFRRLRENREAERPLPALTVVYLASSEVRNSIVIATVLVVLVFVPLFALQGMEGRIFAPLGISYVTSIVASLLVSLTVTPALASYLLPRSRALGRAERDSPLVRWLKQIDRQLLERVLARPVLVMASAALLFAGAVAIIPMLGTEFLPPFNEGSLTISVVQPAGTSLSESNRIGTMVERLLASVPEVVSVARRTGRAELDEHAEGVNSSDVEVRLRPGDREQAAVLADVRARLALVPGVVINIGQPISHRLDHLLSGVRAQIAVKIFGDDLGVLRAKAEDVRRAMALVPGVVDLSVEPQVLLPQIPIAIDRVAAARYGMAPGEVAEQLETALSGRQVGAVLDGQRSFALVVRSDSAARLSLDQISALTVATPTGAHVPVRELALVEWGSGPNQILHENGQRRIVVQANVAGQSLGEVISGIKSSVASRVALPEGYFITYGGQFESQQSATRLLMLLAVMAVVGMFAVLYAHFRSARIVLQILLNIPLALVGAVVAITLTDATISVATIVGFITLTGIASRNGIMMISHYLHLMREEGEGFTREMIVRGSLERLVPVLMTALTAGLALIPLGLAHGAPGKEILHPVAIVILGGLVSSTLLDIFLTPAVFWRFGRTAAQQYFERRAASTVTAVAPTANDEHPNTNTSIRSES